MPGASPTLALPFPFQDEVGDAVSVENLADAVDAALLSAITGATLTTRRPAALIKRTSGTQSFATGAGFANLTYTTEMFDNDGMANVGVDNERLTVVTPGVYLIGSFWFLDTATNETQVTSQTAIITINGSILAGRKMRFGVGGAIAMVHRLSAADIIRSQFQWVGTSSPKNITQAALGARWICSL